MVKFSWRLLWRMFLVLSAMSVISKLCDTYIEQGLGGPVFFTMFMLMAAIGQANREVDLELENEKLKEKICQNSSN